jgi:hypothetical protein
VVDVVGGQAALVAALLRRLDGMGGLADVDPVRTAEIRDLERRLAAEGRRWLDLDVGKAEIDSDESDSEESPVSSSPGDGQWVGTESARRMLGVSRQAVWQRRADFHACKVDGRWLYSLDALLADSERKRAS